MNVLLILQHPRAVDGGDPHLVPLDVVHLVLVDPQLGAGQGDAGHLVLEGGDVERARDHVVEEKLWRRKYA